MARGGTAVRCEEAEGELFAGGVDGFGVSEDKSCVEGVCFQTDDDVARQS